MSQANTIGQGLDAPGHPSEHPWHLSGRGVAKDYRSEEAHEKIGRADPDQGENSNLPHQGQGYERRGSVAGRSRAQRQGQAGHHGLAPVWVARARKPRGRQLDGVVRRLPEQASAKDQGQKVDAAESAQGRRHARDQAHDNAPEA